MTQLPFRESTQQFKMTQETKCKIPECKKDEDNLVIKMTWKINLIPPPAYQN